MAKTGVSDLRSVVAETIGVDITYVTAADEERHLSPAAFVQEYGGTLILIFGTAFATGLLDEAKKSVQEIAKKLGASAWQRIQKAGADLLGLRIGITGNKQLPELQKAVDGLVVLGAELEEDYLRDFVKAGGDAVRCRLVRDHMPEAKAERIAAAVAREVQGHVLTGLRSK